MEGSKHMAKFCPECGGPLISETSKFCTKCGAKIPIITPGVQPPENAHKQESSSKLNDFLGIKEDKKTKQPDLQFGIDAIDNSLNSIEKGAKKKRSTLEWIAICCGGVILLVIVASFIAGMYQGVTSSSSSSPTLSSSTAISVADVQSTTISTSTVSDQSTNLNNGDTAILTYNGNTESVNINYNQMSGKISTVVKNTGDKAFTVPTTIFLVDWGGMEYGPRYISMPSYHSDPIYPGDSIPTEGTISGFFIGTDADLQQKAMQGKLTLLCKFGDQTASWIIKPA
jgi:uncharacterized Zn finger protein (UPF0148 family)